MSTIGFSYEVVNIDSSLKYTRAALVLARRRGYVGAETRLMINLASALRQQGKLAESLDILFKSIKIAEANNATNELGRAYRRLGDVYFDLENFPKGIEYILAALKIDEENNAKSGAAIDHVTLGYAYEKINKLDSASFHTGKAFQQKDLINNWLQYIYQASGNIELKKENYTGAISFLREGLMFSQENNDKKTASDICADISTVYIKVNKKDSAIFYALNGFEHGQKASSKKGIIRSATLLAVLYDSIQPVTSFKYFKIATAAKGSLFGLNNFQTIQDLLSREETRQKELEDAQISYRNRLKLYGTLTALVVLFIIAFILYRNNRHKQKANIILLQQKEKVEFTLDELKSAQAQLIQSAKMAFLGELTAGIAHEIQNPLNFVNNFSEVNSELIAELKNEIATGNMDEITALANDIAINSEKINEHGKRADAIVKGMLQHSRSSSGIKELTDVNALCDEYLRLSIHGYKAKDKSRYAGSNEFNATIATDFDQTIGSINIIKQDIGRVV